MYKRRAKRATIGTPWNGIIYTLLLIGCAKRFIAMTSVGNNKNTNNDNTIFPYLSTDEYTIQKANKRIQK